MSARLYQNGKLTDKAKAKLAKRLEKENVKPKNTRTKATKGKAKAAKAKKPAMKKKAAADAKAITASKMRVEQPQAELVVQSTAPTKKKKAEDLTMADVCDTPPRSKLVEARKEAMNERNDVNWISLIGYNQIEAENEEQLYSQLNAQCNSRFKGQLDAQIGIKCAQKKKDTDAIGAYRGALNDQFRHYLVEDKKKAETKHTAMLQLKAVREEQLAEANAKRRYEELKKRKHELRAVTKLKAALKREKEDNAAKKEKNMAVLKQMLIDNEKQKAIKERARKREEEEAIVLQLEYAKMLKDQEEKREKHLIEIQKKQQQKFNALIASTADIGVKAAEDALRAEKELKRRQKEADVKEALKKKKLADEMELCKAAIDEQIKEKMSKIRTDILDDKAYGKKMSRLHAAYLQEIEDKKVDKKRKQREQSEYLQKQIQGLEDRKKEQKTEMSATEKLINKSLLDQVRNIRMSPNKKRIMMEKKEKSINIDPRAPFQWRYAYRKAPF